MSKLLGVISLPFEAVVFKSLGVVSLPFEAIVFESLGVEYFKFRSMIISKPIKLAFNAVATSYIKEDKLIESFLSNKGLTVL